MSKKLNSSVVANFFLQRAFKQQKSISPMKLIKLVYIAHGWCLAALDHYDILNGEKVEAWDYGPVIPSLYHEFKRFGSQNIDIYSSDLLAEEESTFYTKPRFIEEIKSIEWRLEEENKKSNIKDKIIFILETIWDGYKDYSAWGLSQKTHENGAPWDQTNKGNSKIIDNEKIEKYYIDFLNRVLG